MRRAKKWCVILAALCLLLTNALPVLAANDEYTYTVRIYAGAQGTIGGQDVVEYSGLQYGDRVTFNPQSQVSLKNDSKYYVRGLRISGRDNAESVGSASFMVTGDADYVVSYGILGSAVEYQIRYVNANGTELAPSETYYGNVGDRPVIAFRYIEGYQPQAYNLVGTLLEDASQNIFTFTYRAVENTAATQPTTAAPTEAANNTPTEPGNEGEGGIVAPTEAANTTEAEPGNENESGVSGETEESTEPQEIIDIRDPEVPLADQQPTNEDASSNGNAWPMAVKVGIGVCGAIIVCVILYLILRHKKKETK